MCGKNMFRCDQREFKANRERERGREGKQGSGGATQRHFTGGGACCRRKRKRRRGRRRRRRRRRKRRKRGLIKNRDSLSSKNR